MPPADVDPARLWALFRRHIEIMFRAGPRFESDHGDGWFAASTGAPYLGLNQAVVFDPVDETSLARLIDVTLVADVPRLLGVSATATGLADGGAAALAAAGFQKLPEPEALFHTRHLPPRALATFVVRRADDARGRNGIQRVFSETHGYDEELITSMLGPRLLDRPDVGCWIAWDDDEPASLVFVTCVEGTLSVFDMLTPPAHRRRGAGRMVLTHALQEAAEDSPEPITDTFFWSSPMGRPLYESLGFLAVDGVAAWVLRATEEDLVAVGV